MAKKQNKRKLKVAVVTVLLAAALVFSANQFITLRKAHSSFANYYAFRGCVQLIKRTPTYGICKTGAGRTIKIVEFRGKWYLNGDLPTCIRNFCY